MRSTFQRVTPKERALFSPDDIAAAKAEAVQHDTYEPTLRPHAAEVR